MSRAVQDLIKWEKLLISAHVKSTPWIGDFSKVDSMEYLQLQITYNRIYVTLLLNGQGLEPAILSKAETVTGSKLD